jgi:hypothetical protein
VFFFAWEFPALVTETWGGAIRVQSFKYLKLDLWKFREVQYAANQGNSFYEVLRSLVYAMLS